MNIVEWGKGSLAFQVALLLLIIAGLGLVLWFPSLLDSQSLERLVFKTEANCSVKNRLCNAVNAEQKIGLLIKSEQVHSLKPLQFEVMLAGIKAEQIMLDLKGRDMYMGLNQTLLTKVAGKSNLWRGEAALTVCTTGNMTWIASVVVESSGELLQADFEFDAR